MLKCRGREGRVVGCQKWPKHADAILEWFLMYIQEYGSKKFLADTNLDLKFYHLTGIWLRIVSIQPQLGRGELKINV